MSWLLPRSLLEHTLVSRDSWTPPPPPAQGQHLAGCLSDPAGPRVPVPLLPPRPAVLGTRMASTLGGLWRPKESASSPVQAKAQSPEQFPRACMGQLLGVPVPSFSWARLQTLLGGVRDTDWLLGIVGHSPVSRLLGSHGSLRLGGWSGHVSLDMARILSAQIARKQREV